MFETADGFEALIAIVDVSLAAAFVLAYVGHLKATCHRLAAANTLFLLRIPSEHTHYLTTLIPQFLLITGG